jgi:hypothetical protein
MECRGGAGREGEGNDDNDGINESSFWQGWQG